MLRVLIIAVCLPAFIHAQISAPPFQHLSVDDGLPQNSITALVQGPDGFLWIGTQDGLARYDGYEFKVYRSSEGDTQSLSHNFIWNLNFDEEGHLWITTLGNGLTRLNTKNETFTQFLQSEGDSGLYHWNTFSALKVNNTLWVGTNESLDKINISTGKRSSYFPGKEPSEKEPAILVRALALSSDSAYIWMNSKKGLAQLHISSDSIKYYPQSPFGTSTDLHHIFKIETSGKSSIITTGRSIIEINWQERTEKILFSADSLGLPQGTVFHGFCKGIGRFNYIYSGNGIFRIEKSTGRIVHLAHDPDNPNSLSHNYVIDLCETTDGALWAGTRNGLNAVRTKTEDFIRYGKTNQPDYSLTNLSVRGMIAHSDDDLWVGTDLGINVINSKTGRIHKLDRYIENPSAISGEYILSLIKERDLVWAGLRGNGIMKIEKIAPKKYRVESDILNNASIQFILDEDSILWLGASGSGLLKYHKQKGLVKAYPNTGDERGPSHTFVFTIYRDSHDILWLGTPTGGINLFDRETEKFTTIRTSRDVNNGLSGNTILCFFEDSKGRLWIGTTAGLSLLKTQFSADLIQKARKNPEAVQFQHFGRDAGFPSEVIYGIREDKIGNLWISTNDGLVKFDSEKVVDVFTMEDGCQMDEYNQNADVLLPDGQMAFGGVSGVHIFHPERLGKFYYKPKSIITDVLVNHQPLAEKGIESLPHDLDHLPLSYNDDVISFSFSGLSYVNSNLNSYAYRLIGFDGKWNNASSKKRFATYTNLDPGNYTFEVKSSNCDGIWSNQVARMNISISSPPWQKWYAYVAYALIISSLIFILINWRTERARRKERMKIRIQEARIQERELFRKEAARDFHDEAGNKITRINLLVELARSQAGDTSSLKNYFSKISRNTAQLSSGMRDFNWSLDPEKDSVRDLSLRISEFGESMYEGKSRSFVLKMKLENPQDIALGMALRRDLLMIFKEAINNAVKYSQTSKAELAIFRSSQQLVLELRDFGKGIDKELPLSGYGIKNMISRARKHQADLDIFSDTELGTVVRFKINLTHLG